MKKGSRGDPSPFFGSLAKTRVAQVGNPIGYPFYSAAAAIMSTEQNLRPSLPSLNDTRPSTRANRV